MHSGKPFRYASRLRSRCALRSVAFGKQRIATRIDDVSRDSVDLADDRDARAQTAPGPFGAYPFDAFLVREPQLLELDPSRTRARTAGRDPHRPASFLDGPNRLPNAAVARSHAHGKRAARNHDHLAPALYHPDRDERLAALEGEASRIEQFQRVVRGGSSSKEIGTRCRGPGIGNAGRSVWRRTRV